MKGRTFYVSVQSNFCICCRGQIGAKMKQNEPRWHPLIFLEVGEAYMGIFWPTPGFKREPFTFLWPNFCICSMPPSTWGTRTRTDNLPGLGGGTLYLAPVTTRILFCIEGSNVSPVFLFLWLWRAKPLNGVYSSFQKKVEGTLWPFWSNVLDNNPVT